MIRLTYHTASGNPRDGIERGEIEEGVPNCREWSYMLRSDAPKSVVCVRSTG